MLYTPRQKEYKVVALKKGERGISMKPSNSLSCRVIFYVFLISFLVALNNCGSEGQEQIGDLSWDEDVEPTAWHNLLNSKSYSGQIAVMFKDGTDVRLRADDPDGPFVSLSKGVDLKGINERFAADETDPLLKSVFDISKISRGVESISEEGIEEAITNAANEGVDLTDWNLLYKIDEYSPAVAEKIIGELQKDPAVKWVYPVPFPQLADAGGQDFSGDQLYLKPNETNGGLNIEAGWAAGAHGQNVVVVDNEINWNFTHEELLVVSDDIIGNSGSLPPNPSDPKFIQHGTAVLGILNAKNDGTGVSGISAGSTVKLYKGEGFPLFVGLVTDALNHWVDENGQDDRVKPGDVIVAEMQASGNGPAICTVGDLPSAGTGCVPVEAYPDQFNAIKDAVNAGFIVVETAGNGTLDLSSSEAHIPCAGCPDLATQSTGAIMVGASEGSNKQKAEWSNCGDRVDLFAWGNGVVSTGYGDKYPNTPGSDPNIWYTGSFSGTSSAAAIVGGVVAQVQSYVKSTFDHDGIYLNSKQMRNLLFASGNAQTDSGCSIGRQPDVGEAINLINNWQIPNIDMLIIHPVSDAVVSGIRYDMDGDNKADLISFSRDTKWYVDLSKNGFGSWDLELETPEFSDCPNNRWECMFFPVVGDYNSNGRADLALYDSIHGKWYIKYINSLTLSLSKGEQIVWDRVIDYSSDPNWEEYSRPVPGDYDGDRFLDIGLQAPDGHWFIDYGGFDGVRLFNGKVDYLDKFGTFNKDVKYLTNGQLAQAPGWAWLPLTARVKWGIDANSIIAKSPDGIFNGNRLIQGDPPDFTNIGVGNYPTTYDNNSSYFIAGKFIYIDADDIAFKTNEDDVVLEINKGEWKIYKGADDIDWGLWGDEPIILAPNGVFNDVLCHPVPADYDGDGKDDRTVQCGNTWRIAYSSDPSSQLTEYQLDQASDPLPAYVYAGGMEYQVQLDLFDHYKTNLQCGDLPCDENSTIHDVNPPIGPYFAQCVEYWAPDADYCWNK